MRASFSSASTRSTNLAKIAPPTATTVAVSAASLQLRFRLALGDNFVESDLESWVSSAGMVSILFGCWPSTGYACLISPRWRRAPSVQEAEHRGDEDESGDGRQKQSADDRASERCILLAAVAEPERHRD